MEKFLSNFKSYFLIFLIFFFPFFFLSFTQEFFVTNKLYLLVFGGLFLLFLSVIQLLVSKKISWQKRPFDSLILIFLATIALSTIFSSPNKIQALLNPNFGLVMMIFLAILYFYLSRINHLSSRIYYLGSIILSLITIVFYFQPFKNINLPQAFSFLKNPGFTPLGSQLDLAIFLGFFAVCQIIYVISNGARNLAKRKIIFNFSLLTFNLLALFLAIYSLIKPNIILPPFRLSWYAALEILKNPQTAFLGIGIDNFSSIFAQVKDLAYNQSSLWQIGVFNVSRSTILHIFTEAGILGFAAFGLLIFSVSKLAMKQLNNETIKPFIFSFVYLFICLLVFPSSLIVWFLFFVVLGLINQTPTIDGVSTIDLTDLLLVCVGIVVISLGVIGGAGYLAGRSYASEYYFKKSLDGYTNNNIKELYDNQRKAIILNPFIEKYRLSFSQTNLLIADNLSKKDFGKISEQDRQTITQAIQASISEAKSAVSLNTVKAGNWENLAAIYRNIINVAQGSDVWTISAYQRAIVADPQNPLYRVDLGGVYYSLGKYDEAVNFFQQAISLKPDWPNAQYNYAWALFKKGSYTQAASAMQNVLNLLDQKTYKADYEKAQKDLEEFKKMLPAEKEATNSAEITPSTLALPSPPVTQISPKLDLPKESSPEAK